MIWTDQSSPRQPESELTALVMAEIESACGGSLPLDPRRIQEVARGVASHLADGTATRLLTSSDLLALTSRALGAVGERRLARAITIFASGLVRSGSWSAAGEGAVWTIDLPRLSRPGEASIELTFFSALDRAIEAIAELWEPCGGRGTLGLRRPAAAARALLGGRAARRRESRLADEIARAAAHKLDSLQAARGWADRPRLMIVNS